MCGFAWQEKIGLRSTVDLGTHNYAPKSDVAIVQLLDDENAKILVIFEAYSKSGQSHTTPDVNRADRVRLLIQGSYITRKESKPSVVFYLTRDKHMETILLFSNNQRRDEEKVCSHFGSYEMTSLANLDPDTILLLRREVSVLLAGFVDQSPLPGNQPRMDTKIQLSYTTITHLDGLL